MELWRLTRVASHKLKAIDAVECSEAWDHDTECGQVNTEYVHVMTAVIAKCSVEA